MYDNFFKTSLIAILFFLGTFDPVVIIAQSQGDSTNNRVVDSLKNLFNDSKGSERYDLAFQLFVANVDNKDRQELYKYAKEAYEVAKELGDSLRIVKSERAMGYALMKLGDLDQAIKYDDNALRIARRNNYPDQV